MPAIKIKDKDGNWINLPTIKGADGKSAYQQAVAGGYKGTEAEFQAILATGPWLPVSGGAVTGTLNINTALTVGCVRLETDDYETHQGASTLTFKGSEGAEDVYLSGVLSPVKDGDAASKGYVDSKVAGTTPLLFVSKTIATSAWVSNSTYSDQGYVYRASVACAGVTASHRPDVAFSAADAVSGNFAPVAESYAGGVYIYCKTKPTATVTIPSIVCIKGA